MSKRKILLEQTQSPGDIGTATRAVYDFCRAYPDYQIDLQSPCAEIFEHNPYLTPLDKSDPTVERYQITYDDINKSGQHGNHFADAFRSDIERKVNEPHIFSVNIKNQNSEQIRQNLLKAFKSQWTGLSDENAIDDEYLEKVSNREGGYCHWTVRDLERKYIISWTPDEPDILSIAYSSKKNQWGDITIPKTGINPELYFSNDELSWFNQIHCQFYWDGPFWLLNAGRKSDNVLKQYHRWQEVVDILNEAWQGRVRIVQIGSNSGGGMTHVHPPLKGAFNLVGHTSTRELLRLAYWSTGIIGPISFQFVIGAAQFYNEKRELLREHIPNVVVAGGKEGLRWHVYNHVQWIKKNGCLPCAQSDGCWLGGDKGQCKSLVKPSDMDQTVPLCFEITSPEEVADAVFDYYNGGRLPMPDEELWHIPEGEDKEAVVEKYGKAYSEGVWVE